MTKSDFLRELEKALDVPPGSIAGNERLKDLSCWDSMAALTFLSLADQQLQVTITASQLRACQTMSELLTLLGDKITH